LLDQGFDSLLRAAAEPRDDLSGGTEARVQAPIRVVTRQGEILVTADIGTPGRDQLPVGLLDQGDDKVLTSERGQHAPTGAKARIEAAVRVVSRQREIIGRRVAGIGEPTRDQLAVRLHEQGNGSLETTEVAEDAPIGIEARIEIAGGRQSRNGRAE